MNANLILFPVFAMLLLTTCIGLWMGRLRYRAIDRGELKISYFRHNKGAQLPAVLARVSDNYDNLLALPLLFYVVVILVYITGKADGLQLALAWGFVVSRYAHSYVHTGTNNVIHRALIFWAGSAALTLMWLLLLLKLLNAPG